MGLNSSKLNHKVRKVQPLDNKDVFVSRMHISNGRHYLSDFGRMDSQGLLIEGQLPPLRETLHGRDPTESGSFITLKIYLQNINRLFLIINQKVELHPTNHSGTVLTLYKTYADMSEACIFLFTFTVPRPISFEIPLEKNDSSSIIKKHPPRRLQKLDPTTLPTMLPAERIASKQEAAAPRKGKELEKKVDLAKHSAAQRQHLHKMQMLELNRKREEMNHLQSQAEMKRNLHRQSKINKHKMREMKVKKVRENAMRCHEDENFPPVEHDETFNMDHGNAWHWTRRDLNTTPDCELRNNKLNLWFYPQKHGIEPSYDSSSSDSMDSWIREDTRSCRRPPLVRTRTEKIPAFDEFYDNDF
ncbi:factor associated with metabolism and energy [Gastrophryne carolinensis]